MAYFLIITVLSTLQFDVIYCDVQPSYNSLKNRLALDALTLKTGQNAVVSTLLLRFPLCKLASVAVGNAKTELLSVLGYRTDRTINSCYTEIKGAFDFLKEADLTQVNKMYVNYTDDIDPDFMTNSSLLYGVQVEKVGFNYPSAARSFINRWIETATYRRLRDVVDKYDIDKNTTMMVVSAAHFKANWEYPFDVSLTTNKKFHHYNKKMIPMPMISKIDEFLYWDDGANDLRILKINLGSMGTSVTFIVPNNPQGLPALLKKLHLNPELLTTTKKMMKWTRLRIFLPRFKIKTVVDWTDFLKVIGLKKVFDNEDSGLEAIFKKTAESKHICLNKAKQKVFLEMDEMGVARHELPPDRQSMLRVMVGPGINMMEFSVDRPFYFIIDISLGSISHDVLNGVYYGPDSN